MTQENLNELLFFSPNEAEFNEATLEELLNNQSLMLLLKVHVTANIEDIDDVLLTLIYGEPQKPPGAPECVYQVLCDSVEDESSGEVRNLEGGYTLSHTILRKITSISKEVLTTVIFKLIQMTIHCLTFNKVQADSQE